MNEVGAVLERVLTPRMERLEEQIMALDTKVGSVRNEMLSMRNELKSDIERVENTIGSSIVRVETALGERIARVEQTLGGRIDSLEDRISLTNDIEELKLEVASLRADKHQA